MNCRFTCRAAETNKNGATDGRETRRVMADWEGRREGSSINGWTDADGRAGGAERSGGSLEVGTPTEMFSPSVVNVGWV